MTDMKSHAMTVIHIEETHLERVLSRIEHHAVVIPVNPPDTYYVAEQVVEFLEREQIPFKRITDGEIVRFAEHMFKDINQALEDIREGRMIAGTAPLTPLSMKKLIESARRNGLI